MRHVARCDQLAVGRAGGDGVFDDVVDDHQFEAAGLTWPLPEDVTDAVLQGRLFEKAGSGNRPGPSPAGRAGLGGGASRAQAQARGAVDPVGGIHRKRPRWVSLSALLRTLPRLGAGCP